VKYSTGLLKTCCVLARERPTLVCCQNPSLVLSAFLVTIGKAAGFRVCVDAHNVGLFPAEGRSPSLMKLSAFIQRQAEITLVTNLGMHETVLKNRGRPFILQDRIPDIPKGRPLDLMGGFNILFICSYAADEPYSLVFEAARSLEAGIHLYVTGNYRKRGIDPAGLRDNITLTGYIPEEHYVRMLCSVDATIDLTSRENCLVCGAYESLAAEKPQVLSDTQALRRYFCRGAVYAPHTVRGVLEAIRRVVRERERLAREARELKALRAAQWELKRQALSILLEELAGEGAHPQDARRDIAAGMAGEAHP
jgi:glycosyltransferase involved in cell wall biosynthesis